MQEVEWFSFEQLICIGAGYLGGGTGALGGELGGLGLGEVRGPLVTGAGVGGREGLAGGRRRSKVAWRRTIGDWRRCRR